MTEDYHNVIFRIHEWVMIGILLFTVFAAGPLWLIFLCFRKLRLSWSVHLTQALVYGLAWLLIYLAGQFDPTTFTEWFRD